MSRCVALFCGSRDWRWADAEIIWRDVDALPPSAVVVHGGARGADQIAAERAEALGLHVAEVKPRWDHFGKAAGPRRNSAMLALQPTVVYAYPAGEAKGTNHMIALAQRAGVTVFVRHPLSPGAEVGAHAGGQLDLGSPKEPRLGRA